MPRFADCARSECPSYADLALALAGEFHDVDVDGAERALRRLEEMIAVAAEGDPNEQLGEVAATVAGQIAPPRRRPREDEDFMLDVVLAEGRGQPVILTVIAAEVAARQGMRLGIVSDGRRHMLAHRDADEPLVADFAAGRLRHPRRAARRPVLALLAPGGLRPAHHAGGARPGARRPAPRDARGRAPARAAARPRRALRRAGQPLRRCARG